MKFLNPQAFFLFIPLILAAFFTWKVGMRKRSRLYFPMGSWIDKRPRFTLPSPFRLHFTLRLFSLSLIIIALARPQEIFTKTNRIAESVDMVICFDLSKSMDAIDFKPNRRAVALKTVIDFIKKRADDRIGLVLFSGEAYLAVPITHDHKVLIEAIEKSSNRNLADGTAIGQALAVGVHHLKNSKAKSRVIVLVTDGDNNMGSVNPRTAADLAKGFGLKIYTIGLGKRGRVAFPVKAIDPFGNETEVYQYLTDAVNDELLAEIGLKTGGRSFRAAEDGVLEKIFATIDTLEKTRVETETLVRYGELAYPWILVAAIVLFLELLALNTRWRKIP